MTGTFSTVFLQIDFSDFRYTFDEFGKTIYSLPVHIRILLAVTALILLIILVLLGVILGSRIYKTRRYSRRIMLRQKYQQIFRELLFEDDKIMSESFEKVFSAGDLENTYN